MEYYSALAKRRQDEKQQQKELSAAAESLSLTARRTSSRLSVDADAKIDAQSSTNQTNGHTKQHITTSSFSDEKLDTLCAEDKSQTKYFIGTRIAKEFIIDGQDANNQLFYGSITKYNLNKCTYSVLYDDGDKEDIISEAEMATLVSNAAQSSLSSKGTTSIRKSPQLVADKSEVVTKYQSLEVIPEEKKDEGGGSSSLLSKRRKSPRLLEEGEAKLDATTKSIVDFGGNEDGSCDDAEVEGAIDTATYTVGIRMGKVFFIEDRSVNEMCYGSITRYNSTTQTYSVLYDDGDKENEIAEADMHTLVSNGTKDLTTKFRTKRQSDTSSTNYPVKNATHKQPTNTNSSNIKRTTRSKRKVRDHNSCRLCMHKGCPNRVQKDGICIKHGAKVKRERCRHESCTNWLVSQGVCRRHGAKPQVRKICSHDECNNFAIRLGLCHRHCTKKNLCSVVGCTNGSINKKLGGVCRRHGAPKQLCKHEGCTSQVVNKGVCIRHGAKPYHYICSHKGCNLQVVNSGLCITHGARKMICSHDGCSKQVQNNGVCYKHGARSLLCNHAGCPNMRVKMGFCDRHGRERGIFKKSYLGRRR